MATSSKTQKRLFQVKIGNIRLDQYLSDQNPDLSRGFLQRLTKNGFVSVNGGVRTRPSEKVKTGDKIILTYSPPILQARDDIGLRIVYKDDDILVIDKPAGIVVHTNPTQDKPSIASALLASDDIEVGVGEDEFRPGIVHRLDADTSGLLIVARTKDAYRYLKELFQSRRIEKHYLALVHGSYSKRHGQYDQPIGRSSGSKRLQTGIGREAKTEYWAEESYSFKVDNFTLVRILLHTGRTHQIRVHFSSDGHPVAGDSLYGGKYRKSDAALFPRQFLHANRLKFTLPSGKDKEFISPLPDDLKEALDRLTRL